MSSKKQFTKRAEALGCTWDKDATEITVDAPRGTVFAESGLHYFTNTIGEGESNWPECWAACLDEMSGGTKDCPDADCDICTHEEL